MKKREGDSFNEQNGVGKRCSCCSSGFSFLAATLPSFRVRVMADFVVERYTTVGSRTRLEDLDRATGRAE